MIYALLFIACKELQVCATFILLVEDKRLQNVTRNSSLIACVDAVMNHCSNALGGNCCTWYLPSYNRICKYLWRLYIFKEVATCVLQ